MSGNSQKVIGSLNTSGMPIYPDTKFYQRDLTDGSVYYTRWEDTTDDQLIMKETLSGGSVIKSEKVVGSWTNRASLIYSAIY